MTGRAHMINPNFFLGASQVRKPVNLFSSVNHKSYVSNLHTAHGKKTPAERLNTIETLSLRQL